jgi:lipid-A-disaccharide synthase
LARVLRAQGVWVVQYMGPQVYAWRKGRVGLLARRVHSLACALPFEPSFYQGTGLRVEYVGHPLLDEPLPRGRLEVRKDLGLRADAPFVALLPGSRPGELRRHVPVMEQVRDILSRQGIESLLFPPGSRVSARDALGAADAAIAASGTVTLEAALCGCPTVVMYRLDALSHALARWALDLPYLALPSWIAGRRVFPELVQERATGNLLAQAVSDLLRPGTAQAMRDDLAALAGLVGPPGAARRVAELVEQTARLGGGP